MLKALGLLTYIKNPKNTHFRGSGGLSCYISGILGDISLKVFLSVLNFLLLKKCKGFTNYDEIHNFERTLNLRHAALENKLHLYRDLTAILQLSYRHCLIY